MLFGIHLYLYFPRISSPFVFCLAFLGSLNLKYQIERECQLDIGYIQLAEVGEVPNPRKYRGILLVEDGFLHDCMRRVKLDCLRLALASAFHF